MFKAATAIRTTTLILVACDANFPIFVLAGYGAVRHGDPLAVLLAQPWLLLTAFAFPVSFALAERYQLRPPGDPCGPPPGSSPPRWPSSALRLSPRLRRRAGQRELFSVLAAAMVAEVFLVRGVSPSGRAARGPCTPRWSSAPAVTGAR